MTDKADHIAWAAEAVAVFQEHCRTGDEHAIADLICDLGHLAEERGFDFHVRLKSGGAEMIVTRIEQIGELTVVYCVWIDDDHEVQRAPFPADVWNL